MKKLALILVAALLVGVPVAADNHMPKDETVWDRIGPNDIRVDGHVMAVRQDTFDLRTLDKGLLTFPIPNQEGVMADLEMGNRIQVWYDPSAATNELSGVVTVWEAYVLEPVEVEVETEPAPMPETQLENEIEEGVEEIRDEANDLMEQTEDALATAEAEMEEGAEEVRDEANDAMEQIEDAVETDEVETDYYNTTYRSTLPQTASATPTRSLAGLLLIGVGALVLRTRS